VPQQARAANPFPPAAASYGANPFPAGRMAPPQAGGFPNAASPAAPLPAAPAATPATGPSNPFDLF
jgi:hypothetical protein